MGDGAAHGAGEGEARVEREPGQRRRRLDERVDLGLAGGGHLGWISRVGKRGEERIKRMGGKRPEFPARNKGGRGEGLSIDTSRNDKVQFTEVLG